MQIQIGPVSLSHQRELTRRVKKINMNTVTVYAAKSNIKNNLSVALDPNRLPGPVIARMEMPYYRAGSKTDDGFTLQPTVGAPSYWTIQGRDWFGFISVDFAFSSDPSAISRSMADGESREALLSTLLLSESMGKIFRPELGDKMEIYPYNRNEVIKRCYQSSGTYLNEGGLGLPPGTSVLRYIRKASGEIIPYNPETRHAEFLGLGKKLA